MRQSVGMFLQLAVLMFLPLIIGWQLFFRMPLVYMPACLLLAVVVFTAGQKLRQP